MSRSIPWLRVFVEGVADILERPERSMRSCDRDRFLAYRGVILPTFCERSPREGAIRRDSVLPARAENAQSVTGCNGTQSDAKRCCQLENRQEQSYRGFEPSDKRVGREAARRMTRETIERSEINPTPSVVAPQGVRVDLANGRR